jgi:hypothetical protein
MGRLAHVPIQSNGPADNSNSEFAHKSWGDCLCAVDEDVNVCLLVS